MRRVKNLLAVAIALVAIYNLLPNKPLWVRVTFAAAEAAAGVWFYRVISREGGNSAARRIIADAEARRDSDGQPRQAQLGPPRSLRVLRCAASHPT